MTEKALPPLTAEDFEMRWDAEHVFPFSESEDATIMAYGHHEPVEFVRQVMVYDNLVAGSDYFEEGMDPSEVKHVWAVRTDEADSEYGWYITWGGITETTPQAFPVTVIIR